MSVEERLPEPSNPLGMDGIEFIEYATSQPQAFGDLLQRMGFVPLARHRSREVMLYRQGPMNLIVNSHGWVYSYRHLFGFSVLPRGQYFGVLPKGTLLESPCHKFYLQLIEPPPGADDIQWDEGLVRLGLGAANVPGAVRALQERGIVFVDHGSVQPSDKGALTQFYLGGVTFELVVSHL